MQVDSIINKCNVKVVICSRRQTPKFLNSLNNCPSLTHVVQMDNLSEEEKKESGERLIGMEEIEKDGTKLPRKFPKAKVDDLFTITSTSGVIYFLYHLLFIMDFRALELPNVLCFQMALLTRRRHFS